MKRIPLTVEHIQEIVNKNIMVGSDTARNGSMKRFFYNPFHQLCVIECNHIEYAQGLEWQEMLNIYNDL